MKTKYILHGGVVRLQTDSNKRFYQEMVKGLNEPKVLLVYFAREDDEIPELLARDKVNFAWANPGVDIALTLADQSNFTEQVRVNDTVLFLGGNTGKLIGAVREYNVDLAELFQSKIIAGSSAGAHLISSWYYGHSIKSLGQGFGLVPIAVFTHYRPEEGTEFYLPDEEVQKIEHKLKAKTGNSEVVTIPEKEMVVYEN